MSTDPAAAGADQGAVLLALYDRALPEVYGYLLPRCGDRSVAEDVTSETFLAAVDAVRRGTVPTLTVAWLVGVARHKLVDHWRSAAREERRLQRVASEPEVDHHDPWDAHLDAATARSVLAGLGPHHRAALTLRYLDGLSVPEVARHLDRTVHATEALLVRARRAFRAAYETRPTPPPTPRPEEVTTVADPLDALRLPTAPVAPDPAFASALRERLVAALAPEPTDPDALPTISLRGDTHVTATEPTTTHALCPYLSVGDAAAALDWYRDVLGAIETSRFVGDDGRVGHAEVVIGGSTLMLADEYPEVGVHGPGHYGGTTVTLHLEVVDVDHTFRLAAENGAEVEREPSDQFHGNRNAIVRDPWGHRWMLSQPIGATRADAAADADPGDFGDVRDLTVTGRRPVEPGYITMRTGDLERARAFFGALFTWEVEPGSQEGGGHIANTRFPMGFIEGDVADDPSDPGITLYFRVDDIEPYAARVEELGGRVLSRATYASGGNAECVDDQGFRFDLFQPAPGY